MAKATKYSKTFFKLYRIAAFLSYFLYSLKFFWLFHLNHFFLVSPSCPFNVTRVSNGLYSVCAWVGLLLKVCVFCVHVYVWKERAIYSLCIPGDLSLKLHIHDTSLWGLEGHHQIEGLASAGTHTPSHTHREKITHAHTPALESTAYTLSRKFFSYFWKRFL